MLTTRGWWLFLTVGGMLAVGTWGPFPPLGLMALALLAWFGWEWLAFAVRVRASAPGLRVEREVSDDRGPVTTLWAGRSFEVRVTLYADRRPGLAYALVTDAVPFGLEEAGGERSAEGPLGPGRPAPLRYRVRCAAAGLARFEGVRVRVADLQGLFYHTAFVRAPVVLRVLPVLTDRRASLAATKRVNELPPPGIHRLRRPGSGSELLDLRDYFPGDPPKTIAWKVSARRDRLITKEFESEVPVRCTLLVDTSSSVRLPALAPPRGAGEEEWRPVRALDRLVEIAAGVAQVNAAKRDLTVLCLFDEHDSAVVKPDRTGPHLTQMLHRLADAAALDPTAARVDPGPLVTLAYAFAEEVYPDLLAPGVNDMPWWVTWFLAFPARTRRRPGLLWRLYRRRLPAYLAGTLAVPLLAALLYAGAVALAVFTKRPQDVIARTITRGLAITAVVSALSVACGSVFFSLTTLLGEHFRRTQTWRKRVAALLAVRYGPVPGGLAALLEDEDQLSLLLQRFLGEHRVPYALPLYDPEGRYLFGAPGKIPVLAAALVQAVGRGRDNELFVLLADLLELEDRLEPLLRSVKVALGRHHQVLVVCPWPPSVPLPPGEGGSDGPTWVFPAPPGSKALPRRLGRLMTRRYHAAYDRIRLAFGAVGVQVVCAATDRPVPLILDRIERIRRLRRVH
jgi:uncharacterized protein (DUF58 family)